MMGVVMDAAAIVQATILIRAAIDAGKAVINRLPGRKPTHRVIPVYKLVARDQLLAARAERAIDITGKRWPVSADM